MAKRGKKGEKKGEKGKYVPTASHEAIYPCRYVMIEATMHRGNYYTSIFYYDIFYMMQYDVI